MSKRISVNWFMLVMLALIAGLVTYGFSAFCTSSDWVCYTVCVAVTTLGALVPLALNVQGYDRTKTNMRVISTSFLFIMLIIDMILAFVPAEIPLYVILYGVLLILYILAEQGVYRKGVH